jgi:L-ascorbate metabolism protein UlaG (beta-lactamase superfamily)
MANEFNLKICLTITVLLLIRIGSIQAATITVGPEASYDFDNIQSGIDAAVDGDTILVAPTEFVIIEPITFRGKAITVKSEAGPDVTTIRMGIPSDTNRGCAVVFENKETDMSVLEGFTITGGRGFWFPSVNAFGAGGILFIASSGTVRDCAIVQNSAEYGGGIACAYACSPKLIDCTIAENLAGMDGGGVFLWQGPSLTMINCNITANSANNTGGGLNCYQNSQAFLTNCIISKNSVTGVSPPAAGYGGGIICNENSLLTVNNCNITENSAGIGCGGLLCDNNSQTTMNDCIIIGNTAVVWAGGAGCAHGTLNMTSCVIASNSAGGGGGGLVGHEADDSITISNCTIWGNSGGSDYGGGGIACYGGSSATVINSIIRENISARGQEIFLQQSPTEFSIAYSNIAGGQTRISVDGGSVLGWGEGNIDVDPLFANPGYWADANDPNVAVEPNNPNAVWIDGDYHLKSEEGRWDPVSESWVLDDVTSPCIDAGDPNSPVGDEPEPNGGRVNMGAYGSTSEASMSPAGAEQIVYIQWLGHASVKVWTDDCIVYVDPQRLNITPHDATLVCVTHAHSDHYSPSDIARVSNTQTQFIAPPDVVSQYGSGQTIAPGQTIEFDFVNIKAVPAYNINKTNHPKSNNWVGYIIELGGKRIYVAGDTDLIEEMKSLGDISVAFLPAGGTYSMNATEAAEATGYIKPDLAIPYHWGQIVGTLADAQRFVELARCPAMVMDVGETISSEDWPEYSPLIAHWPLDEAEGDIAHNSVNENPIVLFGEPVWQPNGGKIDGALQFDGINDYGITDFVLDPANGPFSVFAWIKGGAAGQVLISQSDGTGSGETWIGTDPMLGKLMTGLVPPAVGRFVPQPLVSESIVTDDQWHHIGFVWDGSYRALYVDGAEIAKDAAIQNSLKSADSGMNIGAGKNPDEGNFFAGLIDDVRIYNMALSAEEIEELAQ